MKQLFFVLLSLLSLESNGQTFGLKAGANFSKFTTGNFLTARLNTNGSPALSLNGSVIKDNITESINSRSGFVVGAWLRLGRSLYIQPEVLFSTKSGTFDVIKDGKPTNVDIKVSNIDIPILFGMKAKFLRLNAGPLLSLKVSNDENLASALKSYTTGSLENVFAKSVWGYQAGGGIDLGDISFDLRYEGSISDISTINLTSTAGSTQFSQRTNSWQATLAFKIL